MKNSLRTSLAAVLALGCLAAPSVALAAPATAASSTGGLVYGNGNDQGQNGGGSADIWICQVIPRLCGNSKAVAPQD